MKYYIVVSLLFLLNSCVSSAEQKVACSPDIISAKLPQKCGIWDLEYGVINKQGKLVRFNTNSEMVNILGGINTKDLIGKKVVLAGKYWPQVIGGLLGGGGSYTLHNLENAKLVQVYKDGNLDKCKLYNWCSSQK